jgi:hypothetical protein
MKFVEPTELHRKSGDVGHPGARGSDKIRAVVGLRPSFSAQVRWGEPGAPVLFDLTRQFEPRSVAPLQWGMSRWTALTR